MKLSKTLRTAGRVAVAVVVVIMLCMGIALQKDTLVAVWKPMAICVPAAVLTGLLPPEAFSTLTGTMKPLWNRLAAAAIAFSLLFGGLYSLSYFFADKDSAQMMRVEVVNKFTEERHQMKRVSRKVYTRGPRYNVYCLQLEYPDGSLRKIEVSASEYIRIRRGNKVTLELRQGLLGVPVVRLQRPLGTSNQRYGMRTRDTYAPRQYMACACGTHFIKA